MNNPLGFVVADGGWVRQLDLETDQIAIKELGHRCADYLRSYGDARCGANRLPDLFLAMLRPRRVPPERSCVLGIYPHGDGGAGGVPHLAGVLYFLHPDKDLGTWYLPLLLLEPASRGQGLGTAVHGAFARWAAARGAQRLIVAVSDDNVRAGRFWRDHLGYLETQSAVWRQPDAPARTNPEYVRLLAPAVVRAPWTRLRAA